MIETWSLGYDCILIYWRRRRRLSESQKAMKGSLHDEKPWTASAFGIAKSQYITRNMSDIHPPSIVLLLTPWS